MVAINIGGRCPVGAETGEVFFDLKKGNAEKRGEDRSSAQE